MSIKQLSLRAVVLLFALALIILATIITFWFVISSDMGDLGGMYDIYRYYAPLTFFIDHSIHAGEFPTWNPLTYCGLPNTGNPQSFLFYPPFLLRSLLTTEPTPERSNISLALMFGMHFIFMAFCTYLLGRAHGLSFAGAMTAAVAFAFSALVVRRMCEYHFITTIAWLPLLLLLIKKSIDADDFYAKTGIAICAGLTLGMSILGGFLQIINLMGLVAGVYGLFYFLLNHRWRPHQASWYQWLRPWLHNGIAMAVIFVLGACLAVVLLLPAWDLASYTLRTSGVAASKYSDLWRWSPLDFYQRMVLYGGMKYEAETIRNAGIGALLLAAAGLTHHKRRDVFMFLGMYLLLFECSFGPPLPLGALLERMTPFSLSAYSRAYDFGLLPLSLLAGYGVDAMSRPLANRGHSLARAAVLLLMAYVCIAPLASWIEEISFISIDETVRSIPIMTVAVMVLAGTLPLIKPGRVIASLLLLVLVFSETVAWNQSYVPYMARRKVRDLTEIKREDVSIPTTNFRETDPICNRFLYSLRFAMNGVDPLHISAVRDILSGPPRERHPFRGVQNWESTRENTRGNMLFKRSFWLARQYATGPLPGKRAYFPTATTVFLEEDVDLPLPRVEARGLRRSGVSEEFIELPITQPASLFAPVGAGQKRSSTFTISLPEALEGMPPGSSGTVHSTMMLWYTSDANAQFDTWIVQPGTDRSEHGLRHNIRPTAGREIGTEVPLPDFPEMRIRITVENKGSGNFQFRRIHVRSDKQDEDGLITILDRTANTVELQVGPLQGPRILTFLDSYYPGWRAYVNGEQVPILRANEQFKAIVLPEGAHHVFFSFYHDLTWQTFFFSMTVLALALAGLIICWYKRLPGASGEDLEALSTEIVFNRRDPAAARNPSTPPLKVARR